MFVGEIGENFLLLAKISMYAVGIWLKQSLLIDTYPVLINAYVLSYFMCHFFRPLYTCTSTMAYM